MIYVMICLITVMEVKFNFINRKNFFGVDEPNTVIKGIDAKLIDSQYTIHYTVEHFQVEPQTLWSKNRRFIQITINAYSGDILQYNLLILYSYGNNLVYKESYYDENNEKVYAEFDEEQRAIKELVISDFIDRISACNKVDVSYK